MAILQCLVGASGCERNWGDYKWIRNKKRNQLSIHTIEKLVSVHTQLVLQQKLDAQWICEIKKWSDSDGIVASDRAIETSRTITVKDFENYIEEVEKTYVKTMNDGNEAKLNQKYHHVCLYDDENDEIRRVVGIEWHTANGARGVRSQYQVVGSYSAID
jgi:hypothetical protein